MARDMPRACPNTYGQACGNVAILGGDRTPDLTVNLYKFYSSNK